MNTLALSNPRRRLGRAADYVIPGLALLAFATAAQAGADATFGPALERFTDFLEGSGGKIIVLVMRLLQIVARTVPVD